MYTIAPVDYTTFGWCIEAAKKMLEEDANQPQLFDRQSAIERLNHMIQNDCAYVVKRGDTPVGCIGVVKHPHFFNSNILQTSVLLLYVAPQNRGSRALQYLLGALSEIGRGSHIVLSVGAKTSIKPERLKSLGFTHMESVYFKE